MKIFLIYWLPVVLWMSTIFGFSADSASTEHSSRIIGPLLHWIYPSISHQTEDNIIFFARKCAHVTEFAIFATLVLRARRQSLPLKSPFWSWDHFFEALWVACLYASLDEFHQTFVPFREGCIRDVMIDGFGASMGLFVIWQLGRLRNIAIHFTACVALVPLVIWPAGHWLKVW